MKLKFLVRTGPYSNQNIDTVYNLAKKALNRGHDIFIFLDEDGTLNVQAKIKSLEERNITERIKELIRVGAKVGLCATCAKFRGQDKEDIIEGAKFSGLGSWLRKCPIATDSYPLDIEEFEMRKVLVIPNAAPCGTATAAEAYRVLQGLGGMGVETSCLLWETESTRPCGVRTPSTLACRVWKRHTLYFLSSL